MPANRLKADAGQRHGFEMDEASRLTASRAPALNQRAASADDHGLPGFHSDLGSLNRSHALTSLQPFQLFWLMPGDTLAVHPELARIGELNISASRRGNSTRKATQMSLEPV